MKRKYFKMIFAVIFTVFVLTSCKNKTFTINFNSNGGTEVASIVYNEGEDLVLPNNPTKVGHTFKGWYLDEDLEVLFNNENPEIVEDITVYANWEVNIYTIKFYDGSNLLESLDVTYNKLPAPVIPEKEGFLFKSWEPALEVATKDTSYNALFDSVYTLTFVVEDDREEKQYVAETMIDFFIPVKADHDFVGWYLDAQFKDLNTYLTMPEKDLTLYAKFVLSPGYKGNIASLTKTKEDNVFGGLFIYKIDRGRYHWIGGTYSNVELHFPTPDMVNADSYTLEYYNEQTETFEPFVYEDEVLIAEEYYDNFALVLTKPYTFRLHAVTRDNKDYYSNIVNTDFTDIKTSFTGYSLDQSMFISGVMTPYVGFGLEYSVTVYDISDDNESILLEEGYSHKWYRLNPYTYELLLIEDETDNVYKTTKDDIGYYIVAHVAGDKKTVGGYMQTLSMQTVKQPVEVIAFEQTENGIILSFDYSFDLEDNVDIYVYNQDYDLLDIDKIEMSNSGATYFFKIDLEGVEKLYINIDGNSFILVSTEIEHLMQGYEVNLTKD